MTSPGFSLPEELVTNARRERENRALQTITSDLDRLTREGMRGLETIAGAAVEPLKPFAAAISGGLTVPSVDDLTPDWIKQATNQAHQTATSLASGITVPSLDDLTPESMRPKPAASMAAPQTSPASGVPTAMPTGSPPQTGDLRAYTRAKATSLGIDPDVAERVFGEGEGGFDDPVRQSDVVYQGKREESYGPAQMNMTGGLGSALLRERGIDVRDPKNVYAGIDYALETAAKGGWGPWHGAARIGIGPRQGIGAVAPGPAPAAPTAAARQPALTSGPVPGAAPTTLQGITPAQFGLGDADAEAICGPVLMMAFARSNGRNPTIAEAKQLAAQNGGWTSAQGMGGPEATAQALRAMGVPATYAEGPLDLATIRRETANGNPVGINTRGHYFVVEGVDEQGRLDLGNSAKALRASGGRQWFYPQEIEGLGMGAPTGAIYKDSPSSPTPSVAAAPNAGGPAIPAAAPTPAPAGGPTPAGAPVRDDWRQGQQSPLDEARAQNQGGQDLQMKAEQPSDEPLDEGSTPYPRYRRMNVRTRPDGSVIDSLEDENFQTVRGGDEGTRARTWYPPETRNRAVSGAAGLQEWNEPRQPVEYENPVDPAAPNRAVRGIPPYEESGAGQPPSRNDPNLINDEIQYRQPLDATPVRDRWADEQASPDMPSTNFDPDQGPREATPGSVGAENVQQYGPPESEAGPEVDYSYANGGPPTPSAQFQGPIETAAPQPAQVADTTERYLDQSMPSPPGWQAIVDGAGNVVDWVRERAREASTAAYDALEPARRAAAELDGPPGYGQVQSPGPGEPDYVSQGGAVTRALNTPIKPPPIAPDQSPPRPGELSMEQRARLGAGGQLTPEETQEIQQRRTGRRGSLEDDVAAIPSQAAEAGRQSIQEAARSFADALRAGQEGRSLAAAGNALWSAVQVAGLPWTVAARTINEMIPEANVGGVGVGDVVTSIDLIRLGLNGTNALKNAGQRALSPEGLAAIHDAPGNVVRGAANAIDRGIEAVDRGTRAAGVRPSRTSVTPELNPEFVAAQRAENAGRPALPAPEQPQVAPGATETAGVTAGPRRPSAPLVAAGIGARATAGGAVANQAVPEDASPAERAAIIATGAGVGALTSPRAARATARATGRAARGLAEEGARQLMDLTPTPRIVPPGEARRIGGPVRVPEAPMLTEAIENTPGIRITPDGIEANVQRFQKPGDVGREPSSGGVFYSPDNGLGRSVYTFTEEPGYPVTYGGPQEIKGPTVFRRPFVEQSENTPRTLERLAIEAGKTPDEAAEMISDFTALGRGGFSEEAYNALAQRWGVPEMPPGAGLPELRVYEGLRAALARQAGYDSVVRVSQQKRWVGGRTEPILDPPVIREMHDLREATYPTPEGGYTLRPEFQPAPSGAPIGRGGAAVDDGVQMLGSGVVPHRPNTHRGAYEAAQARVDAIRGRLDAASDAAAKAEDSGTAAELKAAWRAYNPIRAEYDAAVDALVASQRRLQDFDAEREAMGFGRAVEPRDLTVDAKARAEEGTSPYPRRGYEPRQTAEIPTTRDDVPRNPSMNAAIPFDPASAAAGAAAGTPTGEEDEADPMRSVAGMAVAGVMGRKGKPSQAISRLGRRVMDTYTAVTPRRVEASTARALQITSDAIAGKIPARGGLSTPPAEMVRSVHEAIVRNLQDTKIVATGIRPGALQAYLNGEGLTSKVDTRDLRKINEITQGQVNVAGGRQMVDPGTGKKQKVPYTLENAADFAQRESTQMRVATGGTRFPDPETGAIDEEAPRVMYGYVSEGQPLVGPNRPTAWLIWDDDTPRITSAHHPYGLTSPGQDIHASMPPGLKAAIWAEDAVAGGRQVPAIMEGGNLVEAARGVPGTSPLTVGWERKGISVGGGRKIADTNWLVGPEGEDAMRASGLVMGMPEHIQRAIARGTMTDPEQVAAALMRGGAPQWNAGRGAVMNPSRSESLILDPDISKIKAIYLTATPKNLATPIAGGGKTGQRLTELQVAQRIRQDILQATNGEKDVPILFNDISQTAPSAAAQKAGASLEGWKPTLISDAQVLEGPPLQLSPGRGRIVDTYTQTVDPATGKPYTNLGGQIPFDPASAAAGAAAGAMSEDEEGQEGDPLRTAAGMFIGAVGNTPQGRRLAQQLARKAKAAAQNTKPANLLEIAQAYRHSVGMLGNVAVTGLINAVGGPVSVAFGLPTEAIKTGVMKGYPAPVVYQAASLAAGLKQATRDALGTALGVVPQSVRNSPDFRPPLSERMQGAAGKAAGYAIDTPGRLATQTPDAFFTTLFNRWGKTRAATEIMQENGISRLDPAGQITEINRLLSNPTPDEATRIEDGAKKFADEMTYKGPSGYWEEVLGSPFRSKRGTTTANDPAVAQIHDLVGSFLMPFYSSIFKIQKLGATYMPGAGMVADRSHPMSERVARQVVGLSFGVWAADRAAQGLITGPGPDDPDERQRLVDTGWAPWSTFVPGLGYVKSDNFAQAAPILKTMGGYYDNERYGKPKPNDDQFSRGERMVKSVLRQFEEFPVVRTAQNLVAMAEKPVEGGANIAIDAASSLVPSMVRGKAASDDPYNRRVDPNAPMGERIKQRALLRLGSIPGVGTRQDVPPSLDRKGQPVPNPKAGLGAFIPQPNPIKPEDPLVAEMGQYGIDLDKGRDRFAYTRAGADSPDGAPGSVRVMLSPSEQQKWLQYRWQWLQDNAPAVQGHPKYQSANEAGRAQAWKNAQTNAEGYADRALKAEIGRDTLLERIRGAPSAEPPVRKAS